MNTLWLVQRRSPERLLFAQLDAPPLAFGQAVDRSQWVPAAVLAARGPRSPALSGAESTGRDLGHAAQLPDWDRQASLPHR